MDCRQRLHVDLADRLVRPAPQYAESYGAATKLKLRGGSGETLIQLWRKEEGHWKIAAWSLEDPFAKTPARPVVPESVSASKAESADQGMVEAANQFLETWFVKDDDKRAAGYFDPESKNCLSIMKQEDVRSWLRSLRRESGRSRVVRDHITRVDMGHPHITEINQPGNDAYTLAKVSDQLVSMHSCSPPATNAATSEDATHSQPQFSKNYYLTAFSFRSAAGQSAVLNLVWAKRSDGWKIVSFYVVSD